MTHILSLRVNDELSERLERLSHATDRSRSYLAQEALREYLVLHEWQVEGIKAALGQVEAGETLSHEDIAEWMNTWGTDNEKEPPGCG